jgi:hypothetical protein
MSEEQKAPVTEEQEKEVQSQEQEQEAASPNQEPEGESPKQEGESPKEEGEGSTQEGEEDEKERRRRRYRVKVTGVYHMHPYFWGSLKAVASISIPGFTIRGIRIVQEKDEEEFRIYPPQGWVGRQEKSIVKVHNKEFWAQICEEVSNVYIVSREKWEKGKKRGKKKKEEREASQAKASQAEETQAKATQAEAVESKE